LIDAAEEKAKLIEELNYTKGFLESVMKKLNNERFVNSAPANVVDLERKKQGRCALTKLKRWKKNI
jgi:valyl-tRNA synthetase